MLDLGERRVAGAFNGTAPAGRTTMGEVLEAAVAATGSGAELVWVPDDRLREAGVEPWMELPLWLPEAEFPGTWAGRHRARAGGRAALPAGGRDGRRRVVVAARGRRGRAWTSGGPSTDLSR